MLIAAFVLLKPAFIEMNLEGSSFTKRPDKTQEAFHTNTKQVTNDLIDLVSIIKSFNVECGKQ